MLNPYTASIPSDVFMGHSWQNIYDEILCRMFETIRSVPLVRTTSKGYSSRIKSWLVDSASNVNSGLMKSM